jgi:hypothetical protein
VDKNPFAVNLAKLSLWLATFAKDHPFTFVDHTLRCGDSLVGLTAHQVEAFHWQPKEEGALLRDMPSRLRHILNARAQILDAADETPYETLAQKLAVTEEQMIDLRLAGDLAIAAFFAADKPKDRDTRRKDLAEKFRRARERVTDLKLEDELQSAVRALKAGQKGITPFHWELEFPEVFTRDNPGLDAFIGNPPFLAGSRISTNFGSSYLSFLMNLHAESHGNGDLVAHFFRRTFALARAQGTIGLIATNTIGQGDTRATGLRWIRKHSGTIYHATRRVRWPGKAAVMVSVLHIVKQVKHGQPSVQVILDGRIVPEITAFLFPTGGDDDPLQLRANAGQSFVGSYLLGMGFTFDDHSPEGSPLHTMRQLIELHPSYSNVIRPYIGGDEVADSPTHSHRRFVIAFGDLVESEARASYPDLMGIVESKVKPQRLAQKDKRAREKWWQFKRTCPELYGAIQGKEFVLAVPRTSRQLSFTLLKNNQVFSENLVILTDQRMFPLLQCRLHEVWVRLTSSTFKDDWGYRPTDCFETFPLPSGWQADRRLERSGIDYFEYRAELMVKHSEGLTTTYNRFHDPHEHDLGIIGLRDLHSIMDRAALDAYGWTDLSPRLEFVLDYEDADDNENGTGRERQKPWRYRWIDEDRDEVLARLLELNRNRAEEEAQSVPDTSAAKTAVKRGRKSTKLAPVVSPNLFEVQEPTE